MKQLTRREFHDLVWSKPMTELAKTFGLSDAALHKTCRKHRIPTPGLGYWAKLAAGKPVTKIAFHEIDDEALNMIRFFPGQSPTLPPEVQEARAKAEAFSQEHPTAPSTGELHPLVKRMRRKLMQVRLQKQTCINLHEPEFFSVAIVPASTERLITFLNQLVMEAERRGYGIEAGEALQLKIDDETVPFHIAEKKDRMPHLPTDKETAALRRWEVECANKRRRNQYIHEWEKPKVAEFDDVFNGQLTLQFEKPGYYGDGLRRKFSDGRYQLEERIQDILITAATCAAAIKAKRAADERREQERQERERLAEIRRRREKLEEKRTAHLEKNMSHWQKAAEIRNFVTAVETKLKVVEYKKAEDRAKVEAWLLWARGYADWVDPLFTALPILLQESDFNSWELG